jgi:4'-phosphopantetheinyl transferase
VRCLLASESELRAQMPPVAQWLTPSEAARLESLGSPARQDTFLAGRWLARRAVQRWCGSDSLPRLDIAVSGACLASDVAGVHVSISHSGQHIACVAGSVPVGIDVEDLGRPHRDPLAIAEVVHGKAQRAALAALPDDARGLAFLQAWTLKEAWLKARSQGLDFALMRTLAFEPTAAGDVAVTRIGALVMAVAADPQLPASIDGPEGASGVVWQRHQTLRGVD